MLEIDPLRDGATPAAAATVVLVRDGDAGGPEVLLVQRHRATAFMGGAHVFPGGRVDPGDSAEALLARLDDAASTAERLGETDLGAGAAALFVAAIRETLEEAGVLLGASGASASELRRGLASGAPFIDVAEAAGARLDGLRLTPFARWITPAVERKRFDTRFFVAQVGHDELASHDEQETVASSWMTPAEAVERHLGGAIDLPPPTLRTLELFRGFANAAALIRSVRTQPLPVVRPVFRDLAGSWVLALPGDPEHPDPTPVLGETTRFVCRDGRWYSR